MRLALDHPGSFPSPLVGFDPRWKIISTLILTIAIAFVRSFPVTLTAFALSLLLAGGARLPRRWYLRRLSAVSLFLGLFLVWLPFLEPGPVWKFGAIEISQAGVLLAAILLCKGLAIVTVFLVLWATSPPGATLKAAQALYVPAIVLHLFALTYRYLHLFAEELVRIRIALRVRAYRNRFGGHSYRTIGSVAGILLVRSFERAERVAQAMRCRGFDGRYRSLVRLRTRPRDLASFLVTALLAAGLISWDVLA